jgi:type I site-specific restriction-modification system R (restriction) subunit
MPEAERDNYGQVVLEHRLRHALARLNPRVAANALEEAFRKLTQPASPSLVVNNHVIHKYLAEGGAGRISRGRRLNRQRSRPCARLRRTGKQRISRGEPVHRG